MIAVKGKCSYFGGKDDTGVGEREGLALIENSDLDHWRYRHLFVSAVNWDNSKGLARNLNPNALYCAMRWSELGLDRSAARNAMVKVSFGSAFVWCQPCDYGPGDGKPVDGQDTRDTGRVIDLSPGALSALGVKTDFEVGVEVYN